MHKYSSFHLKGWRRHLHLIIFESDTRSGRLFNLFLISCILLSVFIVMLDSIAEVHYFWGPWIVYIEWGFTGLFTLELLLRLLCTGKPLRYLFSFYGIIDTLAILPSYISFFISGGHYFLVLRILRVLRVFRLLKLVQYLGEWRHLLAALRGSARKIAVFILASLLITMVLGSLMYIIEGEANGFSSIPQSLYWAIVTLTTVGYGDMSPQTPLGQALASVVMIIGYGMIAVPTGIVSVELSQSRREDWHSKACFECSSEGHDLQAKFCKICGSPFERLQI